MSENSDVWNGKLLENVGKIRCMEWHTVRKCRKNLIHGMVNCWKMSEKFDKSSENVQKIDITYDTYVGIISMRIQGRAL